MDRFLDLTSPSSADPISLSATPSIWRLSFPRALPTAGRLTTPLVPDTTTRVEYRLGRPGYFADAASSALIDKSVSVYKEVGGVLTPIAVMTDPGYAQLSGKPVIEGLPGYGYHSSEEEYVDLTRIAPRIYLAARMFVELSGR